MAAQGVRFSPAFSNQPVCDPARACLQTGKYATQFGCFTNCRRMPSTEKTLAHFLSDDGYMYDADNNKRFFPPDRYRVDAQTDWVLEYLESGTGKKTFFLFTSYIERHHNRQGGQICRGDNPGRSAKQITGPF